MAIDRRSKGKALRRAALIALVWMLALLTWIPKLQGEPYGDHIFELTAQQVLCGIGPVTGWPLNDEGIGTALGSFAPTLPGYLTARAACLLSNLLHISDYQAFLLIGISLTVLITYTASMASGLALRPSLMISYGLATAPCSFSRMAHLHLSQLWAVMPCIAVCGILLARSNYPTEPSKDSYSKASFGLLMGATSFTAQEYYAALGTLCVLICYLVGAANEAKNINRSQVGPINADDTGSTAKNRWKYPAIASGYVAMMIAYLSSKQLLWQIPDWAHEATRRAPIEQFYYGFWPLNIITSPLVNGILKASFWRNELPMRETPFGSSSGILVITALAIVLTTWIKAKGDSTGRLGRCDTMVLAFGGVLVITIIISCVVATSGGLGTLFAVIISPQLRALNRITPFFYCASLAVCAIRVDQVITVATRKKLGNTQA